MERPIFFYSDKSQFSIQLKELLEEYPVIAGSITIHDIKNGNIPKDVKTVPTIYQNGKIFSGVNALTWIKEQIKYYQQMIQNQQNQQQNQNQQQQRGTIPAQGSNISNIPAQGSNIQQMNQQQQRMAQMTQQQNMNQQQQKQKLPTDVIDQPQNVFVKESGEQYVVESYCDENGICGTDLSLFEKRYENGKQFDGCQDLNTHVKSSNNFMSVYEQPSK